MPYPSIDLKTGLGKICKKYAEKYNFMAPDIAALSRSQ